MNVKVQCPCGKGFKFSESTLGKSVKCPQCGNSRTYGAQDVVKRYEDEAAATQPPAPALPSPGRPVTSPAARPLLKASRPVPVPAKPKTQGMDPRTKLLLFGGSAGGVCALVILVVLLMFRGNSSATTPRPVPVAVSKPEKPVGAAVAATPAGKLRLSELLEQLRKSVVWIAAERGVLQSSGTGFVVRADGIILTNYHVIREARRIRVGWENGVGLEALDAELLLGFPEEDLALLRVGRDKLTTTQIASDSPTRGIDVVALGFPLSDAFGQESMSVTRGIVTGTGHLSMDGKEWPDIVRIDAQINPGNSGGPLVDVERARVVGVVFAKAGALSAASGYGFAIPTSRVMALVPELAGDTLAFERRLEAESRVRADSPTWRKELERTRPYFNDLTSSSPEIRRSIPVATLIQALQDADATVRSFAARALEERGAEAASAKDALTRALQDSNPGVRVDAATALAAVSPKDPKVLEILLSALRSDNGSRREAAAIALGRIGNRDARVLQALVEGLKTGDKSAFDASLRALDALKSEGQRAALPVVISRLEKALGGGDTLSPLVLVDALAVCGAESPVLVAPILLRILKSRKSSLDIACTRALSEMGPAALPYLRELLGEKDAALRSLGVSTIGGLRPVEEPAIDAVDTLAKDPNPGVRAAVLSALAGASRDGAFVPLAKVLRFADDPSGDVRASCASALGMLSTLPPDGSKSLTRALDDSDAGVRRAALDSLRTHVFAAAKLVDEIAGKLTDPDTGVRRLAAEALGVIGPAAKSALPQLLEVVGDPREDKSVRSSAYLAVTRISRQK